MNDHFGHWNWVKLTGLGTLLLKRYRLAIREMNIHWENLKEFTEGKGPDTVKWEAMIRAWEGELEKPENSRDKTVINPYEVPRSGLTESDVRLHLTEAEAQEAAEGLFAIHDVGPTAFLSQLLELEDQHNRQTDEDEAEHVENIPIVLPLSLPASERISGCRSGLASIEEQLRKAHLRASLNSLQNHLHIKFRLLTYRKTNIKAQGMITKSQALLKRNQRQIESDAKKYRAAWRALESIRGEGKSGWKKLSHQDVRMMGNDDNSALGMERKWVGKQTRDREAALNAVMQTDNNHGGMISSDSRSSSDGNDGNENLDRVRAQVGEGYRKTSWIWREEGTGDLVDQATLDEFVRVGLLEEEKRRVLVSLEYHAKEWEGRATYDGPLSAGKDTAHLEGVQAYALSQAAVFCALAKRFVGLWKGVGVDVEGDEAREMDGASEDEEEEDAEVFGVDEDAEIPDNI
ncbi:hypothetical protein GGU10DRAFT_337786 [Lentinula aff. detonsa]|uniref:Uncharacterized protein n=1 Tax=Lentinula aff. detonsa TaxID=2804958 RepID=A0AA38L288_9AGAR|nr:hypothetical protein GGU10DRAFT_337786 [Lentinula aff. detonsa]